MVKTIRDDKPRVYFDCNKCPAFCCSVYDRVQVTKRDITRLAKHFNVSFETARRRYTRINKESGERVLRRVEDSIFHETCMFLNQETRGCGIYHARPAVCREYPDRSRCAYYDLLQFERRQQDDETVVPLIQITFREVKEEKVKRDNGVEKVWEWEPEGSKTVNRRS
ncbi:MAG TPA: YkgJ family cysteine cluster protein [Pyrinomonadaceae bacterium]|nr:YkgJ family cysteine cluster protein [Pyrinomonadaceae bacterium]